MRTEMQSVAMGASAWLSLMTLASLPSCTGKADSPATVLGESDTPAVATSDAATGGTGALDAVATSDVPARSGSDAVATADAPGPTDVPSGEDASGPTDVWTDPETTTPPDTTEPIDMGPPPDLGPPPLPAKYTTEVPAYDQQVADRAACTYGKGAVTTTTVGPNVLHGDAMPFKHVVLLMLENRSFDHYFSKLADPKYYGPGNVDVANCDHARGHEIDDFHDCTDPETGQLDNTPDRNPDNWLSPPALVPRFHENRYCTVDTAHDWNHVHLQWNEGAMDGFVATSNIYGAGGGGARAMGYYDDTDIPFYYWMANTFATSDRHFCSLLGPTWPNRYYYLSSTSHGRSKTPDTPVDENLPNLMNQMDAAKRSWRIYRAGTVSFAAGAYAAIEYIGADLWDEDSSLIGTTFEADVAKNALPDLSIVDPNFTGSGQNDEHPPSNIQKGQALVARVIKTLASNIDVWRNTVLIVTYDEHGGYYDHVSPPAACPPDDKKPPTGAFDRLGIRIPLLVVSPFAKAHYMSHLVTDLTSVTRFVQNRFDLPAMTARDANAWPMLDLFDFQNPPFWDPPTIPMDLATIGPDGIAWCASHPPGTGAPVGVGGNPTPIPVPLVCESIDVEPNDSRALAVKLKDLSDCDLGIDSSLGGALAGDGDVDYFTFRGIDKTLCYADPKVQLLSDDFEACIFVACSQGTTVLWDEDEDGDTCNGGTETWIDSGTTKGCCVTKKGGEARVEYSCTKLGGLDDSADIYLRVRSLTPPQNAEEAATAGECRDYYIEYRF